MIMLDNLSKLPEGYFRMFVCKTLDNVDCDFAYLHPTKKFYSCFCYYIKPLTNTGNEV